MREITDKRNCDLCGRIKITTYIHIGQELKITHVDLRAKSMPIGKVDDNEVYEIRPIKHICGQCLKAVYSAIPQG